MRIVNVSKDLGELCTYEVDTLEQGSDVTGLPRTEHKFLIEGHQRRQSVFALIAKAAAKTTEL
ncbi:MAG TPA: hypothetical protein VJX48_08520 [Xanthobacteraceae bacterium]|nr:hypothetical protein [Xanthobacteraceae bacterium]